MKPNLFHFATSELSNDAIICWMLSWGNIPEAPLHNLSQDLIGHFFGMPSDTLRVNNVEIVRQHKNIDVFAKVNESLLLVIEDKVSALAGWNQLEGYKEAVLTSYQETHSRDNMAFIYLTSNYLFGI